MIRKENLGMITGSVIGIIFIMILVFLVSPKTVNVNGIKYSAIDSPGQMVYYFRVSDDELFRVMSELENEYIRCRDEEKIQKYQTLKSNIYEEMRKELGPRYRIVETCNLITIIKVIDTGVEEKYLKKKSDILKSLDELTITNCE